MSFSKSELESKHLAELHALAADAGVPRFRLLHRDELVEELLVRSAAPAPAPEPEEDRPAEEPRRRRRRRAPLAEAEPVEEPSAQALAEDEGEPEGEELHPVTGVLEVLSKGHGFVRLHGL